MAPAGAAFATIKSAIAQPSCDVVVVAAGTYRERLRITRSIRIVGAGAGATIIDGQSNGSVIATGCGRERVVLERLTIRGGSAPAGGGIENCADLTLRRASVVGNSASNGQGGGIDNAGRLAASWTTIAGNRAGGASGAGGGIFNRGTMELHAVTISDNVAGFRSGGIQAQGGQTSRLENVTLSGNRAGDTGGAMVVAGGASVEITASTVASNSVSRSGGAGGLWIVGNARAESTIVAANDGRDCDGRMASRGHNLGGDGTCFRGRTDLRAARPRLGALADNGGPVATMLLGAGSAAIGAGYPSGRSCGGADARGVPRPAGRRCDIGAYERATCLGVAIDRVGTSSADRLTGTPGRDGFLGLEGDDVLDGVEGDDAFCAGDGVDAVEAGGGDDVVRGGAGGDRLLGGAGDDAIWGQLGRDRIDGGSGRDRCAGGPGDDVVRNCSP